MFCEEINKQFFILYIFLSVHLTKTKQDIRFVASDEPFPSQGLSIDE